MNIDKLSQFSLKTSPLKQVKEEADQQSPYVNTENDMSPFSSTRMGGEVKFSKSAGGRNNRTGLQASLTD